MFFYFRERVAELSCRHFGDDWEEARFKRLASYIQEVTMDVVSMDTDLDIIILEGFPESQPMSPMSPMIPASQQRRNRITSDSESAETAETQQNSQNDKSAETAETQQDSQNDKSAETAETQQDSQNDKYLFNMITFTATCL